MGSPLGCNPPISVSFPSHDLYLCVSRIPHAFHGNSGSPVLVKIGGMRLTGVGEVFSPESYRLIGVVSGYLGEYADSSRVPAATVLTGDVHDNSGITLVVPAEELSKLLKSPDVQAAQDARIRDLPRRP
jgi:hypothetical protein